MRRSARRGRPPALPGQPGRREGELDGDARLGAAEGAGSAAGAAAARPRYRAMLRPTWRTASAAGLLVRSWSAVTAVGRGSSGALVMTRCRRDPRPAARQAATRSGSADIWQRLPTQGKARSTSSRRRLQPASGRCYGNRDASRPSVYRSSSSRSHIERIGTPIRLAFMGPRGGGRDVEHASYDLPALRASLFGPPASRPAHA
jgi:hypothetical protein